MGTTAEKLTYLNTTKQNLKTVINTTGAGLTDESTFRSYANVLNDKILGAINGDVDLFEEYPKVSGNGTDLSLNGVVEGKMSITPHGVSKQESTTGYNIMNFNVSGQDSKVTVNDDGTITINGAGGFGIAMEPITLLANTTYKQKIEVVSGSLTGNINNSFMSFNGGGSIWLSSTNYVAYTPTEDQTKTMLWVNASSTFNNLKIKIWGYKGTENKDWEPYTGGIPAPNPSYPYPVKSVTGENSLILQNENLYNKNTSVSEELNGSDGTASSSNTYCTSDYIRVIPGQDYYLTGKNDGYSNCFYDNNKNFIQTIQKTTGVITVPDNQNIAFIRFNSNKTYKNTIMFIKGSTAPSTYVEHEEQNYPITLKSDNLIGLDTAQYPVDLKVGDKITLTSQLENTTLQLNLYTNFGDSERNDYWSIQPGQSRTITVAKDSKAIAWNRLFSGLAWVNKGETSLSYKPYIANPIELNSSPDGTIRDQIVGKPNEWYKREYIGKVVLDGSESGWRLAGTDTNTLRFTNDNIMPNSLALSTSLNGFMCNEFQKYFGNKGIGNIDSEGIAIRDTRNGFSIRILKTRISDLSTFLTWLSEHNAIVYYVLENYEDIPITDTTLINQLNDIYNNAHSHNGITNITTTYEDGNEQMYLDIEALKNVWEVIE